MRRVHEFDAMRGLAAVGIVVFHLWLPRVGILGVGVDLFFVLSGYLITSIILKQRNQPGFLTTFYLRRVLRTWPIYYLSLFAFLVLNAFLARPYPLGGLPYYLSYTQRIQHYWCGTAPAFFPGFGHTWSLAIEEQFYVLWPVLLLLLGRRRLVPLALAFVAIPLVTRACGFQRWILMTKCDGLALGGLLALILEGRLVQTALTRKTWLFALLAIGAIAYLARGAVLLHLLANIWEPAGRPLSVLSVRMFMINVLCCSAVGLVACQAGSRWLAPLRDRRLCYLGQISYGIYLYHYIILDLFADHAAGLGLTNPTVRDALVVGLSLGTAALSWRFVEKPILGLKDRLTYQGAQSEPVGPEPRHARLEPVGCETS
jgi:peptidoglycan/LPS O-acetylase OafA/YrhL